MCFWLKHGSRTVIVTRITIRIATRIVKYELRVVKSNPVRILKLSKHDFSGKRLCDGYGMDII